MCSHARQAGGDSYSEKQTVGVCTGALLGLDQSRSSIHADNQTARDLRVERPAVTRLLHAENPPDPRHDLVR